MREPNWKTVTAEELWKYLGWHFSKANIDAVLVGGGVASIYSEGAYESGDLDFVLRSYFTGDIKGLLESLGFKQEGQSYFHPDCKHLYVEFVSPPLAIGDDSSIKTKKVTFRGQTLQILSPTDSVRDRLASFIHFRSRDSLDQAVLVAKRQKVNLKTIEKWCKAEGGEEEYREFMLRLGGGNKK